MKKVVLFCSSWHQCAEVMAAPLHEMLEKRLGEKIAFISHGGYLHGESYTRFMDDCRNADVVLTDVWNWDNSLRGDQPFVSMMGIVADVKRCNPQVWAFAQTMDGRKRDVHRFATPFECYGTTLVGPVADYLGGKIERDGIEKRYFIRKVLKKFEDLPLECIAGREDDELIVVPTPHDTPKGRFYWMRNNSVWEDGDLLDVQESGDSLYVSGTFHGNKIEDHGESYTIRFTFECSFEKALAC